MFSFKKISSLLASTVMLSSTVALAAAATFPEPFVDSGGNANVAVVWGGTTNAPLDSVAVVDITTALNEEVAARGGGTGVVPADSWPVGNSADKLEIGESIGNVESYISSDELPILADGEITNSKGTATYEQFLYFDDTTSSSVFYGEDDDDNVGLFFRVTSGKVIARYVMDFKTSLKSDIDSDADLDDIEDKEITILGKTYTISDANNGSNGVQLVLLGGALKGTVSNDEEVVLGDYTVSVLVTGSNAAKFTVNGEQTDRLAKGDIEPIGDGNYLAVTDITYQDFAGGIAQATFFIGADKIELTNGSSMVVNSETINEAAVTVSSSEASGDITITDISINMTAEDDLYVPAGGKLSEASDFDEPQVLFTQNWDIMFNGITAPDYDEIKVTSSESDEQYKVEFTNSDGDEISLPLVYANASGLFGGDDYDKKLVLNSSGAITKKDYFILNTADPTSSTADARSFIVQYKGSDSTSDTNPQVTFDILGVETGRTVSLDSDGTFNLKIGGATFNFNNRSAHTSDDFQIGLIAADYSTGGAAGDYLKNYVRTKNNARIDITDTNTSLVTDPWTLHVQVDDGDRDGDTVSLGVEDALNVSFSNASDGDVDSAITGNSAWVTDPDNSDKSTYTTPYGTYIESIDTADSPSQVTIKVPAAVVNPLVYVTSGEAAMGDSGSVVSITDAEIASAASKNIVVVGGSCINTVAASLLGSSSRMCGDTFTAATSVGAGQYLIQTFSRTGGKVATLVAGFNADDTKNAATALTTQDVEITAGKKYVGTTATSLSPVLS